MQIGEVSERSGVPVKTIRYYEEIGVVDHPARTPAGYRQFSLEVIDRLRFVRSAQEVGLTLAEIREIVAFRERGEAPCAHVLALIERRATDVDRRIGELQRMRGDLRTLAERARAIDPARCAPSKVCQILLDEPGGG